MKTALLLFPACLLSACRLLAGPAAVPALPGGAFIEKGQGGLERLVMSAGMGEAAVYFHGAHVAHFKPKGAARPLIWMSPNSQFEAGKPMRGGIPVIFPWFANDAPRKEAPFHGFARTLPWRLASCTVLPGGRMRAIFELASSGATRAILDQDFLLVYSVTVGSELELSLTTRNTGVKPLACDQALHTYYAVSDVRQVSLAGLENARYIDKVDSFREKTGPASPLRITGETDRIFPSNTAAVTITDPGWGRIITVGKEGSRSTIVWNPWAAKAASIADVGADQWPNMVCVETANVAENRLTLAPGKSHELRAVISVRPLK